MLLNNGNAQIGQIGHDLIGGKYREKNTKKRRRIRKYKRGIWGESKQKFMPQCLCGPHCAFVQCAFVIHQINFWWRILILEEVYE